MTEENKKIPGRVIPELTTKEWRRIYLKINSPSPKTAGITQDEQRKRASLFDKVVEFAPMDYEKDRIELEAKDGYDLALTNAEHSILKECFNDSVSESMWTAKSDARLLAKIDNAETSPDISQVKKENVN